MCSRIRSLTSCKLGRLGASWHVLSCYADRPPGCSGPEPSQRLTHVTCKEIEHRPVLIQDLFSLFDVRVVLLHACAHCLITCRPGHPSSCAVHLLNGKSLAELTPRKSSEPFEVCTANLALCSQRAANSAAPEVWVGSNIHRGRAALNSADCGSRVPSLLSSSSGGTGGGGGNASESLQGLIRVCSRDCSGFGGWQVQGFLVHHLGGLLRDLVTQVLDTLLP